MTTTRGEPVRPTLVLAVLFVGAFVMGCAEMLVVGLLDLISEDLEVSVPAVGALVTANAVGQAFGGPLLTLLATRFDRRRVVLATLIVFVLVYLLPVIGADYSVFFISRVIVGAVQGLFIAAAMVMAITVVPPGRSGRAMAVIITGFAAASAVGLPLGTLLGQAVGWRVSFAVVVAVALIILIVAAIVLPSVPTPHESRAVGQAKFAFAPRVVAVLVLAALIFTGIQSAVTYLVPFLAEVTDVSGPGVSVYLLTYGVATTVGSFVGGRFADANAGRALVVGAMGVTVSLTLMFVFGANPLVVAMAVLGIGLFGMSTAPSLQHRVVSLSGPGAPLAASLPASAVNVGIAGGSFAGGLAIDAAGISAAILTGAIVAAISIVIAWATSFLKPVAAAASTPAARRASNVRPIDKR
jgi:MFS transporter, DHA1 family, inner membrane transport protein